MCKFPFHGATILKIVSAGYFVFGPDAAGLKVAPKCLKKTT
jgi:hypothetical protein